MAALSRRKSPCARIEAGGMEARVRQHSEPLQMGNRLGETIMKGLVLAALAVLTLSIATAAALGEDIGGGNAPRPQLQFSLPVCRS